MGLELSGLGWKLQVRVTKLRERPNVPCNYNSEGRNERRGEKLKEQVVILVKLEFLEHPSPHYPEKI